MYQLNSKKYVSQRRPNPVKVGRTEFDHLGGYEDWSVFWTLRWKSSHYPLGIAGRTKKPLLRGIIKTEGLR